MIRFSFCCLSLGLVLLGQSLGQQPGYKLKPLFTEQVNASARVGFKYVKTVLGDDAKRGTAAIEKTYAVYAAEQPVMKETGATADVRNFSEELSYAVEFWAQDGAIANYFTFTKNGDTLQAVIKPTFRDKCDLQEQQIVITGGVLHYVRSIILRNSLLYTTRIETRVNFDQKGLYKQHALYFGIDIRWIDSHSGASIRGKAVYAMP